jgi:type I restriction enzyme R subunit
MPKSITEDMIEKAAVELLILEHKYKYLNCYTKNQDDLSDGTGRIDKKQVILPQILLNKLYDLNLIPNIPQEVIEKTAENYAVIYTVTSSVIILNAIKKFATEKKFLSNLMTKK